MPHPRAEAAGRRDQWRGDALGRIRPPRRARPACASSSGKRIVQFNTAPWTSEFEQLRKEGIDLPATEQLDDAGVSRKLSEIVEAMSRRHTFLEHTDHLSDRQLYEQLYHETLHEAKKDVPVEAEAFSSIDMVGSGSDDDNETYLQLLCE